MEKTTFNNFPEIISAASKSILGIIALIVLLIGFIAFYFFKKSDDKVKVYVFVLLLVSFSFCVAALFINDNSSSSGRTAKSVFIDTNLNRSLDSGNLTRYQKSSSIILNLDKKTFRNKTQEAQFMLKILGYSIPLDDGYEGPATTNAIEDFQKKHNLPISGTADDQTITLLRDRAQKSFLRNENR